MPNATTLGCAANSVAVFLGTPVALSCDGGLTYDATTDKLSVGALRIGTSTTAGWVLTADANGNGTWTAGGSGGGITNGAANGVIPKSDGTNLVGSGISETAPGRFTLYGAPATSYQSVLTTDWDLGVVVNKQNGVGTAYAFLYDMFRGPAARLVVATGGYVSLGDGSTTSVLRHGMADGAVKWGTPGYPTNTPVPYTHSFATDAPTADTSGANATLTPGIGRGNAAGSTLTISTPDPVASGSTVQTVTPRIVLSSTGVNLPGLPVFADNTAAAALATGDVYRTSTGVLMVKY